MCDRKSDRCDDCPEVDNLKETIKGYKCVVDIANASNATQQRCIDNLKETIKGRDRATVEYTRIITEKDKTLDLLKDELLTAFKTVRQLCPLFVMYGCDICIDRRICVTTKRIAELQKEVAV